MPDNAITESELDHYRTWIGRRTTLHDDVCRDVIARFAVAIDRPMPVDDLVPQMWHYGLFLNDVPTAQLGPDGHPPRGGAMPPVHLPRRMFAGSEVTFLAPLKIGIPASCISEIVSVDRRKGSRGDLILVRVSDDIGQDGRSCIKERARSFILTPDPRFHRCKPTMVWKPIAATRSGRRKAWRCLGSPP